MNKRIVMVWLLAAGSLSAAEYFADAVNGNDANDGQTEATANCRSRPRSRSRTPTGVPFRPIWSASASAASRR